MSFQGKIIVLTGLDRVGKETQSYLLKEAFRRSGQPVEGMTFPEYGQHWAAEFVRATLNEEYIRVQRYEQHVPWEGAGDESIDYRPVGPSVWLQPKKHPNIFQMWQSCDRIDRQPWINETLKHSHIVADRYEIDALAYGLVDGCSPWWLESMATLYRPSDLALVMVGQPFPRKGEKADINERDPEFQQKVRETYAGLVNARPENRVLVDVDPYRCADPISSKRWVHRAIVGTIREKLNIGLDPLAYDEIDELEKVRLGE